jgi:4-hydroxy-tetrahydrodipicolinate synthase
MNISGVICALLTPYDDSGHRVDVDRLKRHVRFLLDRGVHGLFVAGTAGEGVLLSQEERKEIYSVTVDAVGKKVPVIAHVGHLRVRDAVDLAQHAKNVGADAVASVPPYYFPLDDEALYDFFRSVAEAAHPLPFYVYNFPDTTNNKVSSTLLQRLIQKIPNLKGIKDSSKSMNQFRSYLADVPELDALVGSDSLALEAFKAGGRGIVSTVANVFPAEVVQMYESFLNRDVERAGQYQTFVEEARRVLKQGPYITTYKAALQLLGFGSFGGVRPPLRSLRDDEWKSLKSALKRLDDMPGKVRT